MELPAARVVKTRGVLIATPRRPSRLAHNAREALAVAFGLWPLTAAMLLAVGLIIMAGNAGH